VIDRWVRFWDGPEAPWSMALVRLCLGLALLGDYLHMGWLGLVEPLLTPGPDGGLAGRVGADPALWQALFGTGPTAAWGLYLGLVGASAGVALGCLSRTSAAVLLVLSAQMAWILPAGDRGIDMLSRNVLMILVFAGGGQALSVDAWVRRWRGRPRASLGRWARRLLLAQLVVMYWTAGVQKYAQHWWPWGRFSALWVIWQDWPMTSVAASDWVQTDVAWRFSQLATALTIGWEVTFPVVVWFWWLQATAERGGRLRTWVIRWRPDRVYVALGVVFHLGIAVWLDLGVFPWAMLALYPAFVEPGVWRRMYGQLVGEAPDNIEKRAGLHKE